MKLKPRLVSLSNHGPSELQGIDGTAWGGKYFALGGANRSTFKDPEAVSDTISSLQSQAMTLQLFSTVKYRQSDLFRELTPHFIMTVG